MIDLIQANIAAEERLRSSEKHFDMNKMLYSLFLLLRTFKKITLREKGKEAEREGEKRPCVRETSVGCFSLMPLTDQGPACNPGMCPDLGIEPVTFCFVE